MEKVLITQTGNFLRFNPITEQFYFQTPDGKLLREVTHSEAEELGPKLLYAEIQYLNPHIELPTWKFVWTQQISVDLSNYDADLCQNGGKYGYSTHIDLFTAKVNGKWVLRIITRYSTTSEIEYDELNGQFCNTCIVDIVNSHNLSETDKMWYYSSGNSLMLEQCSEVVSFKWLWQLETSVYDGELTKYTPLSLAVKKQIIKNLKDVGVDLRDGYERKLSRNGKYKSWIEKR